jgi:hypothetical protein
MVATGIVQPRCPDPGPGRMLGIGMSATNGTDPPQPPSPLRTRARTHLACRVSLLPFIAFDGDARTPPPSSVAPRGPETGFDERGWLARRGVHVVVRGEDVRVVCRRGGIGGVADRLHTHVAKTLARGTVGERRALLAGIVLGEDTGLDRSQADDFKASELMHLLSVDALGEMSEADTFARTRPQPLK